jgi:hypothetical protein
MANTYTTNASLPKPTYVQLIHEDIELLKGAYNSALDMLDVQYKAVNIATNATIVNTLGARFCRLYDTSLAGSITTIVGAITGVPFTLIGAGSNASTANHLLYDVEPYALTANFQFNLGQGQNITLVWDGARYIEIARSSSTY